MGKEGVFVVFRDVLLIVHFANFTIRIILLVDVMKLSIEECFTKFES